MDLTQVFWKAIHSDHVVESTTDKAYSKIKRATLQKLVFFDDNQERVVFERPDNVDKFDIRWRLRTMVDGGNAQVVKERWWVIDDGKFHIVNENLEHSTFTNAEEADRKPITNTPLDNL